MDKNVSIARQQGNWSLFYFSRNIFLSFEKPKKLEKMDSKDFWSDGELI